MARVYTVAQIIEQARNRAEMSGSNFILDSEALDWVDSARAEVDDFLYSAYDGDYNLTSSAITTVAGSASYVLPTDFKNLRYVEVYDGSTYYETSMLPIRQLTRIKNSTSTWPVSVYWRLEGISRITFFPAPPQNGSTINIQYQPVHELTSLSGTIADINGYTTFIVDTVAMKMAQKSEMYERVGYLKNSRNEWKEAIIASAQANNSAQPERATIHDNLSYDDELWDWRRGGF